MNRGRSPQKRKHGSDVPERKTGKSADGVEFDMKKARFDIIKFAMTGLSGTAKHDAETALAISLGAKAPKSTYVNYKELMVTRKKEKEERQLLRQNFSKPKPVKSDNKNDKTKKKPVKHSLETTGIYKVKFPPGSTSKNQNSFKGKGRGKGRRN